jgi:CRISPR-associated DxTHG motif protein
MIISILGTSGAFKNRDSCTPVCDEDGVIQFQSAKYNSEIFGLKSQSYKNATEFLLKNFDDKFVFIGTACAVEFQKIILADSLEGKDVEYIEVEDDSLDDIFEKILELLQHNSSIMLDITHGFRHQPIMAIFASTLSQFLERRELKIVFAKEVEMFKEYSYIYLDEYIEITQISLLLTGFIRTLNFIPVNDMKLLNNGVFEDFSKSLLSNDMRGVEKNYALLQKELKRLQKSEELKHISSLVTKVEVELEPLEMFEFLSSFQKYMLLSKLMVEKNYLVIALAYLFESLREYSSYRFEELCESISFKDSYERNDNVMKSIGNYRKENKILKRYPNLYKQNKELFKQVNKLYNKLRKRRNALAHINTKSNFEDIKADLEKMIEKVEELYNDGLLREIKQ